MESISFVGKKTGRTLYRFEMPEEEYSAVHDEGAGACVRCGIEVVCGVEPDAERYECESCGERGVYGLEQLLIMGRITFVEGVE